MFRLAMDITCKLKFVFDASDFDVANHPPVELANE